MNNDLKNKTKQQLYSEVVKLRTAENNAFKEIANLKAIKEQLNANLELADSDYHELRMMYAKLSKQTKRHDLVVTVLVVSILLNLSLLLLLILK